MVTNGWMSEWLHWTVPWAMSLLWNNTSVMFIYFMAITKLVVNIIGTALNNVIETHHTLNTLIIHFLFIDYMYSCPDTGGYTGPILVFNDLIAHIDSITRYCTCGGSWIYFMLKIVFLPDNLCLVHASPWHHHGYIWAMNEICR